MVCNMLRWCITSNQPPLCCVLRVGSRHVSCECVDSVWLSGQGNRQVSNNRITHSARVCKKTGKSNHDTGEVDALPNDVCYLLGFQLQGTGAATTQPFEMLCRQ